MRGLVVLSLFAISALGQDFNPVAKQRDPESILQLPEGIRRDLVNRQCVVPKYYGDDVGTKDPAYTKGHFRSGTSIDYVVVCHIPTRKIQDSRLFEYGGCVERGNYLPRDVRSFTPRR